MTDTIPVDASTAHDLPREAQLLLLREIEVRHLGTAEADEERALGILSERVRFALFGALGIAAVAASGLATIDREFDLRLVIGGFFALTIAVYAAWDAHAHLEILSHQRRTRKMVRYQETMARMFPGDLWQVPSDEELKKVDDELETSKRIRSTTVLSTLATSLGVVAMLWAALQFSPTKELSSRGPSVPPDRATPAVRVATSGQVAVTASPSKNDSENR